MKSFQEWFVSSGVWIFQMLAGLLGAGGYSLLLFCRIPIIPFVLMISGLILSLSSAFFWAFVTDKK